MWPLCCPKLVRDMASPNGKGTLTRPIMTGTSTSGLMPAICNRTFPFGNVLFVLECVQIITSVALEYPLISAHTSNLIKVTCRSSCSASSSPVAAQ